METVFIDAIYECTNCNQTLDENEYLFENKNGLGCPHCGGKVIIKVRDIGKIFERKNINDIKKGDLIYTSGNDESYEVIDIESKGTKLFVALKKYRKIDISKYKWLNCQIGSY